MDWFLYDRGLRHERDNAYFLLNCSTALTTPITKATDDILHYILSVENIVQVLHVYVAHSLYDIYKISLRVMLKMYSY